MKKIRIIILCIVLITATLAVLRLWPDKNAQKYGPKAERILAATRSEVSPLIKGAHLTIDSDRKTTCALSDDTMLNYYSCTSIAGVVSEQNSDIERTQQAATQMDSLLRQKGWQAVANNFSMYADSADYSFSNLFKRGATIHYTNDKCELEVKIQEQATTKGQLSCTYETKLPGERAG
jgi:hypothetical protein